MLRGEHSLRLHKTNIYGRRNAARTIVKHGEFRLKLHLQLINPLSRVYQHQCASQTQEESTFMELFKSVEENHGGAILSKRCRWKDRLYEETN